MWTKFFFERFWSSDQRNDLFVCMPFHQEFDSRFAEIFILSARQAGFDKAVRVDQSTAGNVIIDKIWEGIANSKMILVDLTDDPKSRGHVNGNVLLELGVAQAMREPSAVVIIRDQDPVTADFDARGLTINKPPGGQVTIEWLSELLRDSVDNYNWTESKRVKAAAESIDDNGLKLMFQLGGSLKGSTHFNTRNFNSLQKMSVLRLIDLGLLKFATGAPNKPSEHAYHWTSFGYAVMEYLGVERLQP